MHAETKVLSVMLVLIILINVFASYRCISSPFFDVKRKLYQIISIWLLPVVGAVFVFHFSVPMNVGPDYKTTDAHPANPQKVGLVELSEVNRDD